MHVIVYVHTCVFTLRINNCSGNKILVV